MAPEQRRDPAGPSPFDDTALLKALSWMGYFSLHPWLTTVIGVAVAVAVFSYMIPRP